MSPASGMGRSEVETCQVNLYIYIYIYIYIYYIYNAHCTMYNVHNVDNRVSTEQYKLLEYAVYTIMSMHCIVYTV